MTQIVTVTPKYKCSFVAIEYYNKILSTGTNATIYEYNCYRWGEMEIEITEDEIVELYKNKEGDIDFTEYDSTFVCAIDTKNIFYKLVDKGFTKTELNEIKESVTNKNLEYDCDVEFMEEHGGWDLSDTLYSIKDGYEIKKE